MIELSGYAKQKAGFASAEIGKRLQPALLGFFEKLGLVQTQRHEASPSEGSEKPCSGSGGGDESRASFVPVRLAKWTISSC